MNYFHLFVIKPLAQPHAQSLSKKERIARENRDRERFV